MYVSFSADNHSFDSVVAAAAPRQKSVPVRRVKTGTYLYHEGDKATHVYEVTEGVLRMARLMKNGRRQVIAFGYPGDIIGLPSDGLHHTDCDALSDAMVRPYRSSLLENGAHDPELQRALLQAALREISAMQDHFMMLGRKSASEKLASLLLVLSERAGETLGENVQFKLPMSRTDIADFLGLSTETVSRTFGQFRKSGIVALDNVYTVIILKPKLLKYIANNDDG